MVEEQAIRIEIDTAKLTMRTLMDALHMAVQAMSQHNYGEQSMASLNRHGNTLTSVELDTGVIKEFKAKLKEYAVDFAVTKDKSTGKLYVWLKGQDFARMETAIEECIKHSPEEKAQALKDVLDHAAQQVAKARQERPAPVPEVGERT